MGIYIGFYSMLFLFSFFYIYLIRFKMKANKIPQEKIRKRILQFFCSFWGIIISLSSVAYSYHVLEMNSYLVILLILIIAIFIFIGIRRVNQWMNETYVL